MNYDFLLISGTDAAKFLQGQVTCDVTTLQPDAIQLAALCNPQGRIISLFHIVKHQDAYYLYMPSDMVALTQQALKKYAVFYKVVMQPFTEKLSEHLMQKLNDAIDDPLTPVVYTETSGKFLPHELNLDKLNAISFDKGCYTGQEIIARMHYRGKLKTHLNLTSVATTNAPQPGDELFYLENEKKIPAGTIVKVTRENESYQVLFICKDEDVSKTFIF